MNNLRFQKKQAAPNGPIKRITPSSLSNLIPTRTQVLAQVAASLELKKVNKALLNLLKSSVFLKLYQSSEDSYQSVGSWKNFAMLKEIMGSK